MSCAEEERQLVNWLALGDTHINIDLDTYFN